MFSTCVLFLNDEQIKLSCWGKCKDCRALGKSPRSVPCASTTLFWEQHRAHSDLAHLWRRFPPQKPQRGCMEGKFYWLMLVMSMP